MGMLGGDVGRGCWEGVMGGDVGRGCWEGMLGGDVGRGCWEGMWRVREQGEGDVVIHM